MHIVATYLSFAICILRGTDNDDFCMWGQTEKKLRVVHGFDLKPMQMLTFKKAVQKKNNYDGRQGLGLLSGVESLITSLDGEMNLLSHLELSPIIR